MWSGREGFLAFGIALTDRQEDLEMRTFLVNLDRNTERLAWMQEQLGKLGIAYERFPAVDGRALSKEERQRVYSPARAWLANGHLLQPGELGCALSHLGIYRRLVDENIPYALLLEDDCTFDDDFMDSLRLAERSIKAQRRQVLLLSGHGLTQVEKKSRRGVVAIESGACTDAYLITREAAAAILKMNDPIVVPCDTWRRFRQRADVELYRVFPVGLYQDGQRFPVSEIPKNHVVRCGHSKLTWLIYRSIGIVCDCLLYRLTGK